MIGDAIAGILSQETDFPFEIIIHDDASTDGTAEVIAAYREDYPELIRVMTQETNQWSQGRRIVPEFLMPMARAPYIALCDGDDYWVDPRKLAKQIEFLEANSEYVICYGDCIGVSYPGGGRSRVAGTRWDVSAEELQNGPSIFTLTVCFRNILGAWPKELSREGYGDTMLWSLLGDFGKGRYLPDVDPSVYRIHERGTHSMQGGARRVENQLATFFALVVYRLGKEENAIAFRHMQDIVVLCFKLAKVSLLTGIFVRALKKLLQATLGR